MVICPIYLGLVHLSTCANLLTVLVVLGEHVPNIIVVRASPAL